jgi:hypothetical protein
MPEVAFNGSVNMKYLTLLLLVVGLAPLPFTVHASNDVCTSCADSKDDDGDSSDAWSAQQGDDVLNPDGESPNDFAGGVEDGISNGGIDLPQMDPLRPQPEPTGLPQ